MSGRQYKLREAEKGLKGRIVLELVPGQADSTRGMLHLPDGTPSEAMFDVVKALGEAYQAGLEDRSAEFIPHLDSPADEVRAAVRDLALSTLASYLDGEFATTRHTRMAYLIERGTIDPLNGTVDVEAGTERKRFRLRVLVEKL